MISNQTNIAQLEAHFIQYGGHFFDYEEDGLLVFTQDGSRVHRITDLSDENLRSVSTFFETPLTSESSKKSSTEPWVSECDGVCSCEKEIEKYGEDIQRILTVNLNCDLLCSLESFSCLNEAIFRELNQSQILLRFQFQKSYDSWLGLMESFCTYWEKAIKKKRLIVVLSGAFDEITEEDSSCFSKHAIQLEYVHHLAEEGFHFSEKAQNVLSQIAGKGFRLPIVWYVDDQCVNHVLPLIDKAMFLNFNSGFSLPLFQNNIFAKESLHMPDTDSYLSLLSEVYEKYGDITMTYFFL